ncbi:hypothetical protein LXL04_003665 [Taraxacum kok-saghyz]
MGIPLHAFSYRDAEKNSRKTIRFASENSRHRPYFLLRDSNAKQATFVVVDIKPRHPSKAVEDADDVDNIIERPLPHKYGIICKKQKLVQTRTIIGFENARINLANAEEPNQVDCFPRNQRTSQPRKPVPIASSEEPNQVDRASPFLDFINGDGGAVHGINTARVVVCGFHIVLECLKNGERHLRNFRAISERHLQQDDAVSSSFRLKNWKPKTRLKKFDFTNLPFQLQKYRGSEAGPWDEI